MNILFITSNRVGDAVLSTGLLASLVDRYPDARFTIACGPYAAGLFRGVPRLDQLIVMEKKSWNRHWIALWKAVIGTRWDLIVDLRNSIVPKFLRATQRATPTRKTGKHKVMENATALALDPPPPPRLWTDAEAERNAARILPAARPLLALGPAANWPVKQWPIERYAALAKKLTSPGSPLAGASVIIIADAHERAQVTPLLQSIAPDKRVEVIGNDLLTVAACLKQCRLFVGNDSGLMHVAAAMGTPTLGLFGPGYEDIYGPWGPDCTFIRTPESRETLLARLPDLSAKEPNLMGGLTVDRVFEAARGLLSRAP